MQLEMRVELGGDGMDGRLRRAGKLELAARLERDRAAAVRVVEADQRAVVLDRRPAEARLGAFEQRPDAALALVGDGRQIGRVERDLLVLDADAERFGAACRRPPATRPDRRGDSMISASTTSRAMQDSE